MADFSRELWFERSDAIYERSDTNREQWFRIRIPKSELSGDGPRLLNKTSLTDAGSVSYCLMW